jgi:hypothetical protein
VGPNGAPVINGTTGPKGDAGAQGAAGTTGPAGPAGAAAPAGAFTVEAVFEAAANSSACFQPRVVVAANSSEASTVAGCFNNAEPYCYPLNFGTAADLYTA